jgi:hypothetical protein
MRPPEPHASGVVVLPPEDNAAMRVDEIVSAEVNVGPKWRVTYHTLINLDPEDVPHIEGLSPEDNLWHNFGEDLLQIRNDDKGLLLDVGWYPSWEPTGEYVLRILEADAENYDWEHPREQFRTRSLRELLEAIRRLTA